MAKDVTCFVEARPEAPNFGQTTITIEETDPDRAEFLTVCESFFRENDRPEVADRFHQAIAQTPSD